MKARKESGTTTKSSAASSNPKSSAPPANKTGSNTSLDMVKKAEQMASDKAAKNPPAKPADPSAKNEPKTESIFAGWWEAITNPLGT